MTMISALRCGKLTPRLSGLLLRRSTHQPSVFARRGLMIEPFAARRLASTQSETPKDSGESGVSQAAVAIAALTGIGALGALYMEFSGPTIGPAVPLPQASSPDNPRVFFDIAIGQRKAGRVEMELFTKVCPRTVENFRCLCTGEKGMGRSGRPLHYKGSTFHRIIPNFMCQGGDFTRGDGTGGESIYGSTFKDEFELGIVKHSSSMLLSMANAGRNTNGSQFFVTTAPASHLNEKHVVFGRVVKGHEIIREVEMVGSASGTPRSRVTIYNCGEIPKQQAES
eukprot:gnl/TRDRNA2_/TRDRNA2_197831_c0_seq1.p1 gnl/TRDRNA2_/TRDRNA2_197831_c0~~gnl/TRDRNA2_/TRDRNA2_197831_c0_seq1.p1  ORF type:complete len:282 (+),score=35.70 gnl/TRDRNA2_/TRDRNA2_197831_c0_seq1:33-878(+)